MTEARIIVDLGFGDSGKGRTVDFFVREEVRLGRMPWVIRYNGGAQAGHNVVTEDGRHHTFAQLGAGSFSPGVRTYLTEDFVLHPGALGVEASHLMAKGVEDPLGRLVIDGRSLVITPFHQALGRLRELSRGDAAHGSCGVGVGECVAQSKVAGREALRAHHLLGTDSALVERLQQMQAVLRESAMAVPALGQLADEERAFFEDDTIPKRYVASIEAVLDAVQKRRLRMDVDGEVAASMVASGEPLVFEGAQGVLLDQDHGFFPHVTYGVCTTANAERWLAAQGFRGETERIGVLRTYMTRHGQGPLPTSDVSLDQFDEPHNASFGWQGAFRRGHPDCVLWRYAIEVNGGVDALFVTHMDRLGVLPMTLVTGYEGPSEKWYCDGRLLRVASDLALRCEATQVLAAARGVGKPAPADQPGFVDALEAELQERVRFVSTGPGAQDVRRC